MPNRKQLRILLIEDNENDALITVYQLEQSGFDTTFERVETEKDMKSALQNTPWDVILVDYNLPSFNGLDALRLVNELGIDIPFILVSGVIIEDIVVEAMRMGAHDCVRKENLNRLGAIIEREIQAAKTRREKRQIVEELKVSHANLEREVVKRTEAYRKAKDEAETANRYKSEFLANISHELRNPMHHILSYSKYGIEKIDQSKEKLLHYFAQTRKSAERLMVLLDDLLDISKMESGRMDYTMEINNIYQIITDVVADLKPSAEEKSLVIRVNDPQISTKLVCDYFKIGQVARNLLSNAIKFTSDNKCIEISFRQDIGEEPNTAAKALQVSILDQGVGVPENELTSIFNKFNQSSRTKTGAGGTGLGLAICEEIISAHGGKIWVESNPEGGSNFIFTLPYGDTRA